MLRYISAKHFTGCTATPLLIIRCPKCIVHLKQEGNLIFSHKITIAQLLGQLLRERSGSSLLNLREISSNVDNILAAKIKSVHECAYI